MSDIFVPRRAALARSYEMCRPIKSRPVKLTILQNSFLRAGRRMNLLRKGSTEDQVCFLDCRISLSSRSAQTMSGYGRP
jgi:hypothetical protein